MWDYQEDSAAPIPRKKKKSNHRDYEKTLEDSELVNETQLFPLVEFFLS